MTEVISRPQNMADDSRLTVSDNCRDCDTTASVTSDLNKYQAPCTCKPMNPSVQYACADDPGPLPSNRKQEDVPPALPPRPHNGPGGNPNRRNHSAISSTQQAVQGSTWCSSRRKYGWWCIGCGSVAATLGGLLAAAHILLRAYTASPQHLETVPAAVPAAMLVLTGICIMSLARRRNRYSYMIKVVGACCLVCALTCVLVTITTTVIHMNKLQTLRICEYTNRTQTCTCYSTPLEVQSLQDEGSRCVFEGVSGCAVVHGALYWCLRAIFALSVSAVLVCIFSCMLAYQLLSHERKKMYWEQLELRCRSLYRPPTNGNGGPITQNRQLQNGCSCCAQCHSSQSAWDVNMQQNFWTPGRVGNLYSPNPGTVRKMSPWSWFPWPRNSANQRCRQQVGGVGSAGTVGAGNAGSVVMGPPNHPSSGDSAYGFCDENNPHHYSSHNNYNYAQNYSQGSDLESSGNIWGPPPPYSPQGRALSRHHLHNDPATTTLLHHHMDMHRNSIQVHACASRNSAYLAHLAHLRPEIAHELAHMGPPDLAHIAPELAHLSPELAHLAPELAHLRHVHAVADMGHVRSHAGDVRIQEVTADTNRSQPELTARNVVELQHQVSRGRLVPYTCSRTRGGQNTLTRGQRNDKQCVVNNVGVIIGERASTLQRPKRGKENFAFQNDHRLSVDCQRNAESEVYFADVSSCCNVSLKAECCQKPNISGLVGTIETRQDSTSGDSDAGGSATFKTQPKSRKNKMKNELNIAATHERIDHRSSMSGSSGMNERIVSKQDERRSNNQSFERAEQLRSSIMNNERNSTLTRSKRNESADQVDGFTHSSDERSKYYKMSPKNIIMAAPLHPRQSSSESNKSSISLNYLNRFDQSFRRDKSDVIHENKVDMSPNKHDVSENDMSNGGMSK